MPELLNADDFNSVEDIDEYFAKKIRRAEDEEKADLERQQANLRVAFREKQLLKQTLDLARQQAFAKYPLAAEYDTMFESLTSAEAIEARAKQIQETQQKAIDEAAEKVRQELAPAAARAQYGAPGAGATGAPPANAVQDESAKVEEKVWSMLRRGDAPAKQDVYAFTGARIREAIQQANTNPSYKRGADSPSDRRVQDARRSERGGKDVLPKQ